MQTFSFRRVLTVAGLLACVLGGLLAVKAPSQSPRRELPAQEIGRYQLVAVAGGARIIDTTTGRCWKLVEKQVDYKTDISVGRRTVESWEEQSPDWAKPK